MIGGSFRKESSIAVANVGITKASGGMIIASVSENGNGTKMVRMIGGVAVMCVL